MAGSIKLILILSTLISLSTALTEIENLILYSDLIPIICATVLPTNNNELLQFLCAVSAIRSGNFPGAPAVTSYSNPVYASFPSPAPSFYSPNTSPPVVTKTYGPSNQNAPVTYTTIGAAAPVTTYEYNTSPYSNYPQGTQVTTISTPGAVTYNTPTLSYTPQGQVITQGPLNTYTTTPAHKSVTYNGLRANIS